MKLFCVNARIFCIGMSTWQYEEGTPERHKIKYCLTSYAFAGMRMYELRFYTMVYFKAQIKVLEKEIGVSIP